MAVYWMTEALPVPITSLLPVVLFPLLGIMDTGKVCTAYMKVGFIALINMTCVVLYMLRSEIFNHLSPSNRRKQI